MRRRSPWGLTPAVCAGASGSLAGPVSASNVPTRMPALVPMRDDIRLATDVRIIASHHDRSGDYERITRFFASQLAYLAGRLQAMPEGESTVLDNTCLLWLSSMFSGSVHDDSKLPNLTLGSLGGTLATGGTSAAAQGRALGLL